MIKSGLCLLTEPRFQQQHMNMYQSRLPLLSRWISNFKNKELKDKKEVGLHYDDIFSIIVIVEL